MDTLRSIIAIGLVTAWLPAASLLAQRPVMPQPPPSSQRPTRTVIVDTDAGPDDLMAIAFLLCRRDVHIEAVTVTVGLAHPVPGAANLLRLLELAGRGDTPVFVGRATPLAGAREFPADWRRLSDELPGVSLPSSSRRPESRRAADFLAERLDDASRPVDVLALGALTNLAEAFSQRPTAARKLRSLVAMGGAVDVPGNLAAGGNTENKTAEWNLFVDPVAAAKVFASEAAIRLIPLDATERVPLDVAIWQEIQRRAATPLGRFVAQVLGTVEPNLKDGTYFAWDPLAAVALVEPSVVRVSRLAIEIMQRAPDEGRTRRVPRGKVNAGVALGADAQKFRSLFLGALLAQ